MCLQIRRKTQRNEMKRKYLEKNKPNAKGYIVGYKTFKTYGDRLISFYRGDNVYKGLFESDRHSKTLTHEEQISREISYGCHFFLTPEDAKTDIDSSPMTSSETNYVIRKIYFKPEDLVAVGRFNIWCDSGVVMQYRLY